MNLSKLKLGASLTFLVLAIISGLGSAGFSYVVEQAQVWCTHVFTWGGWLMLVYTPLVFMLCVWLLKKYFPYADGSGLPQGYAVDIFSRERLRQIYSIRSAIGKVILTFLSISAGASLGKEGPTIQISSSLFACMPRLSEDNRRLLIKIGAGVGVAAAFNAPLGGMIFALEEYLKQVNPKVATLLVGATLAAVFSSNSFSGDLPYLGPINPALLTHHPWQVALPALLIGCCCGLMGALFTWLMVGVSVNKTFALNRWRKQHYLLNALICGVIVAVIGILSHGISFGNGADMVRTYLDSNSEAPWYFAVAKFSGALASVAANVPGGYFSTALSIGAGIGDIIHRLFSTYPLVQFYLLGMAGFLAAITQAPITAVVMLVEMSNSSQFSLPILLSAFVASLIAEQFGHSVYHQQVLNYIDPRDYRKTLA